MNRVAIIGNLTKDPEIRATTGREQMTVCNMTVAVNDGYGDKQRTAFVPVTVFGKSADNCEKYLRRGSKIGVTGKLQTGSYKNKDGQTVYTWGVIADAYGGIEFLTTKNGEVTHVAQQTDMPPAAEQQTGFGELQDDDIPF